MGLTVSLSPCCFTLIDDQAPTLLQVTAAIKVSKNKGIVCSKTLVAAAGKEELVHRMCKEVNHSGSSTLWFNSCQVVRTCSNLAQLLHGRHAGLLPAVRHLQGAAAGPS